MPATDINRSERFSALEDFALIWVPVVAAGSGIPTRAEINAGTNLRPEVATWEGFVVEAGEIETPSLDKFTGSIPGRVSITPGVLRMYADKAGDDVRSILTDGTTGSIVMMDNGDDPTDGTMDIWPVRVNKQSKERSGDNATMIVIRFTHNRLPIEDVDIPAAA